MKYIKYLFLLLFIVLLQGCASLGDVYKVVSDVPNDKALVYVYRPSNFVGGGASYYLYANDKIITHLYNGGYYPFITDPGKVEFWGRTESKSSVELMLEAGKTYYVKGAITMGIVIGRPNISIVPSETGNEEIKQCKYIPEKDWEAVMKKEEQERNEMLGHDW